MSSINITEFNGANHCLRSSQPPSSFDLLKPLRKKLDSFEIQNSRTAHLIAKMIPAQCPFERTVKVLGYTIIRIPPLCKLNPFYEEFVYLRFRALCFLADRCGEDISAYC